MITRLNIAKSKSGHYSVTLRVLDLEGNVTRILREGKLFDLPAAPPTY